MAEWERNLVANKTGPKNVGEFEPDYPITVDRCNENNQALLNNAVAGAIKTYTTPQRATNDTAITQTYSHGLGNVPDLAYMTLNILSSGLPFGYFPGDTIKVNDLTHSTVYFTNQNIIFNNFKLQDFRVKAKDAITTYAVSGITANWSITVVLF